MKSTLCLKNILFNYDKSKLGLNRPILNNLNLELEKGEIACILGSSGGGKTTLLRTITGFINPDKGQIVIDNQIVYDHNEKNSVIPSEKRKVGMVFQDYALFPHLNVAENILFGLTKGNINKATVNQKIRLKEMLSLTGLSSLSKAYIDDLSGGQKQRVALARALAPTPKLILFDEPFSNLDPSLRQPLARDVRDMLKETDSTALFVTHDQSEAFSIADKIGILKDGFFQQWDTPYLIYHEPKNIDIAKFIGQGALINGYRNDTNIETALGNFPLNLNQSSNQNIRGEMKGLIRPDDIIHDDESTLTATVVKKIFRGADFLYILKLKSHEQVLSFVPSHHDHPLYKPIGIKLEVDHVVTFDSNMESTIF